MLSRTFKVFGKEEVKIRFPSRVQKLVLCLPALSISYVLIPSTPTKLIDLLMSYSHRRQVNQLHKLAFPPSQPIPMLGDHRHRWEEDRRAILWRLEWIGRGWCVRTRQKNSSWPLAGWRLSNGCRGHRRRSLRSGIPASIWCANKAGTTTTSP